MKKMIVTIEVEVTDNAEVEEVSEQIIVSTRGPIEDIVDISIEEI